MRELSALETDGLASKENVIDSSGNVADSSVSRSMSLPEQLDHQVIKTFPNSPSTSVINAAILHYSGSDQLASENVTNENVCEDKSH
jgi:hypothetical protein